MKAKANAKKLPDVEPAYEPRFLSDEQARYALEVWRMTGGTRYQRMLETAARVAAHYPDLSRTAVYKDLDGMLGAHVGRILQ